MEKTYSSSEIQRIAMITKMQAIHWTQTGVITPLQDARGRGSRRVYSWENLIEMMICRELSKYGVEKWVMNHIIHGMNKPTIFPGQTGEETSYDSYWDFFKQNPKTDIVYLVITYLKPLEALSTVGTYILLGKSEKSIHLISSATKIFKETKGIKNTENGQDQEKSKHGYSRPASMNIIRKTDIEYWAELFSSFVVISIDKLVAEASAG